VLTLLLVPLGLAALTGCSSDDDSSSDADAPDTSTSETTDAADTTDTTAAGDGEAATGGTEYVAEVWADNWFSLYVDGEPVGEDSVPITTERSFNSETISFTADPGFTLGVLARDFIEDDTGLEYIGTDRQQMGDAGIIVQVTDTATGEVVAASNSDWTGLVIHTAPTNPECESSSDPEAECENDISTEPDGWADPDFDDSSWTAATTYTADEVGAKEGYDDVDWDSSASLIWSDDLETDNTILWRTTTA
jgi:hypothetical protein